jgi:hypothetical protein
MDHKSKTLPGFLPAQSNLLHMRRERYLQPDLQIRLSHYTCPIHSLNSSPNVRPFHFLAYGWYRDDMDSLFCGPGPGPGAMGLSGPLGMDPRTGLRAVTIAPDPLEGRGSTLPA